MLKNNSCSPIHLDLLVAQQYYESCGLLCTNIIQEKESTEYGACTFEINNRHIAFRVAKITPTKVGQFVTLWKRLDTGIIAPYDTADPVDLVIISVRKEDRLGQFVFPKTVLHKKDIFSHKGTGGKRALRVYPPWDIANSNQAKDTQAWQLHYFFEITITAVAKSNSIHSLLLAH